MKTENFAVFSLHVTEPLGRRVVNRLRHERSKVPAFSLEKDPDAFDSETAAKFMLTQVLDHAGWLRELERPKIGKTKSEFQSLGTERVALTGTKIVKFRQFIEGIPVYGTLVTIELDDKRECLALNATVATPKIRSHLAKVSPLAALEVAARHAGWRRERPQRTPILHYFLDRKGKWHLAYIVENVRTHQSHSRTHRKPKENYSPLVHDYVVDAMNRKLLAELPRTPSFAEIEERAQDGRGNLRRFRAVKTNDALQLIDPELNLATYDFNYRDPRVGRSRLPGKHCVTLKPGKSWDPSAVSAHANAATVAKYLRNVLKRNNIDNKGGPIVSVVNCVVAEEEDDGDGVWLNAFWDGKQMVYGQDAYDDGLRSLASNPDVVAHELFHGVTSNTARLEYVFETGALNESYSDIFGLLISNANNRDIGSWDWLMGDGLSSDVKAYRSFANPSDRRLDKPQPKHMRKYRHTLDDKGGVHHNSGIHNYAAYKIMTAKDGRGRYLFKPRELAAMFYIALTQHLARQSTFSASRRAVLLATRSYFRRLAKSKRPKGEFNKRVRAVELGFDAAGIA